MWLAGGHAWLAGVRGACMVPSRACMVPRGHAWFPGGACVVPRGGMHGCRGVCIGYNEIRSMSGRYASYWNAFLLFHCDHILLFFDFLNRVLIQTQKEISLHTSVRYLDFHDRTVPNQWC